MTIESKLEAPKDQQESKQAPMEASAPQQEECLFYIAPPPIPGQTGWSIVPW